MSETTTPVTPAFKPDLEVLRYIPDWLQPAWDFLSPYPGLLTVLLILAAYGFGRLLRMLINRAMMRVANKTSTKADDHLIEYLTRPIVLTTVTLALMLAVSAFKLPRGLHDATLSMLATILLFSWMRAGLRTARIVLELISSHHHRLAGLGGCDWYCRGFCRPRFPCQPVFRNFPGGRFTL